MNLNDYEEDIMTITDVAKYLRFSNQKIYSLLESGELEGAKVGRSWRIHKASVEKFMKKIGLISES